MEAMDLCRSSGFHFCQSLYEKVSVERKTFSQTKPGQRVITLTDRDPYSACRCTGRQAP